MAGFLLIDVPSVLQGKVISKLEWKSYLRLQQTCTDIGAIVQSNRNIRVHMKHKVLLEKDENGDSGWKYYIRTPLSDVVVEPRYMYGVRYGSLYLPADISQEFDEFINFLKKYRITATILFCGVSETKDQCTALIKILKPQAVNMNSSGSDRFEGLFNTKGVDDVFVRVEPDDALYVMRRLASKFLRVSLYANTPRDYTIDQFTAVHKDILQQLLSIPQSMSHFIFYFHWFETVFLSVNEIGQIFSDFNPMIDTRDDSKIIYSKFPCTLSPIGSSCEMRIVRQNAYYDVVIEYNAPECKK